MLRLVDTVFRFVRGVYQIGARLSALEVHVDHVAAQADELEDSVDYLASRVDEFAGVKPIEEHHHG